MGCLKMSHLQTPHLQMAIFQMVGTIASERYLLLERALRALASSSGGAACPGAQWQIRLILGPFVGHFVIC